MGTKLERIADKSTHESRYCGGNQAGKFCVKPKTNEKRLVIKLKEMKQWLKYNRATPLKVLMPILNLKLLGHYQYYGLTYNIQSLVKYHYNTVAVSLDEPQKSEEKLQLGGI